MGYKRSMCNKTGKEWVKSDWVLKEYVLNAKVSGQYKYIEVVLSFRKNSNCNMFIYIHFLSKA